MFKFFFAIAFSLFATISTAATETEIIRALLDDGNVSGLEENFLRLHNSALKENDFTEVRDVIFKSMATTHDVRIETINAWITANPQSPYAMVAAAQMHLHIAF